MAAMPRRCDRTEGVEGFAPPENEAYLSRQLITYIGNKRSLLGFIGSGLLEAEKRLGKAKLDVFDAFSGSGVVSRYLKRFSRLLITNDIEKYAQVINECYLSNASELDMKALRAIHRSLLERLSGSALRSGFIDAMYAPEDDAGIRPGERAFYTSRNAKYLDTARQYIGELEPELRKYFLAPLLSEASMHANTSGVFKGFYKDRETGIGEFGGRNGDALARIRGDISLPFPVFSDYACEATVHRDDTNHLIDSLPEVDVAYLDPPYNQHPYGSNYFMLNLLVDYIEPKAVSEVSGIPEDWNRSDYNKVRKASRALGDLVERLRAKFLLISFNSEGFIGVDEMKEILGRIGKLKVLETDYNTFKGSRNLSGRPIHVKEYLYLVEKN